MEISDIEDEKIQKVFELMHEEKLRRVNSSSIRTNFSTGHPGSKKRTSKVDRRSAEKRARNSRRANR